jgi:hypothetical protein
MGVRSNLGRSAFRNLVRDAMPDGCNRVLIEEEDAMVGRKLCVWLLMGGWLMVVC